MCRDVPEALHNFGIEFLRFLFAEVFVDLSDCRHVDDYPALIRVLSQETTRQIVRMPPGLNQHECPARCQASVCVVLEPVVHGASNVFVTRFLGILQLVVEQ